MSSIRLSQKHGANPMIPVCFWCGKPKNEVVLLGRLPNDAEAPMYGRVAGDYTPCDECSAGMSKGITFVEADEHPVFDGQKPIHHDLYPTGSFIVIREEAVKSIVHNPQMLSDILEKRKAFVQPEVFKMFSR